MAAAKRSIKSVGLVVKRDRPEAVAFARTLVRFLRSKNKVPLAEDEISKTIGAEPVERHQLGDRADLIVVLGGDGTLLGVARLVASQGIPILGVNLGGLGFLTEVTIKESRAALERVLDGDYEVDRRIMLEAIVERASEELRHAETYQAFNDVVVSKGPLGRMLDLDVFADRKPFCAYRADGLIIATPDRLDCLCARGWRADCLPDPGRGRTGANLPAYVEQPAGCASRFVEIEIHVKAPDHDATFTVDGQESAQLGPSDTIRVHRGRHAVSLIRSAHPYFEIWRDKLHWG